MLTKARGLHFAAEALVFPGGKVDRKDKAFVEGLKSTDRQQIELKITAIREMYEECGILLARHLNSDTLITSYEATQIRARNANSEVLEMTRSESFELATDQLIRFAHWITPPQRPKRFDTHFYIAPAPGFNTKPIVDGYEIVDAKWYRPCDILKEVYSGDLKLVLPTMMNIIKLSEFEGVNEVLEAFNERDIFCVEPKRIETAEGAGFCIPIEAGYGLTTISPDFLRSS